MEHGLGQESISVLKLGATMAFLSIVLIYVIYGITTGKQIGNKVYDSMAYADIQTNTAELQGLSYSDYEVLPAAGVYALTQYNSTNIADITCYICNNTNGLKAESCDNPCILSHMQGKVKLVSKYDNMLGQYHLYVYPYSYSINFDANGGTGQMATQEFIYDNSNSSSIPGQALNKNTFYRQGYTFAGWSLTKGGSVAYTDAQSVKNVLLCGEMTLYAVWR